MKLPRAIRVPVVVLCASLAVPVIAGCRPYWLIGIACAIGFTACTCWLVRQAFAAGYARATDHEQWLRRNMPPARRCVRKVPAGLGRN